MNLLYRFAIKKCSDKIMKESEIVNKIYKFIYNIR